MSRKTKALSLWDRDNVSGRREFLAGPASELARDIVENGGVLAWYADNRIDPGGRMKSELSFQEFYERALVALGHPPDEDMAPYDALVELADEVALRAYLVGVAVGRQTGGAR